MKKEISVLGIIGYFCPVVSLFSLSYMMDKNWKVTISKRISVMGQSVVGIVSVGYIAYIFIILFHLRRE